MNANGRMIWRLMAGQRLRYLGGIAALVVASSFLYLVPLVTQVTLDGVLGAEATGAGGLTGRLVDGLGGRKFLAERLWIPACVLVGLTALAGLFTYLRSRLAATASERIAQRLRDRIYDHLQHLPCAYHDGASTGDLVQRCTSDVETFREFLASQVVEIGRAVVMLLIPLPLMFALDGRMTVAALAIILPLVCFSYFFFGRIKRQFLRVDEAEGAMTAALQENLTGIRVVRAFARQAYEIRRFGEKIAAHRDLNFQLYRLFAQYWSLSDFLCMAQKALVMVLGGYWLYRGELAVGTYFFFLAAVNLFIWPMRMLGRILAELGKALVAIGRIREILEEERESVPEPAAVPAAAIPAAPCLRPALLASGAERGGGALAGRSEGPALRGELRFERVSFAYQRTKEEAQTLGASDQVRAGPRAPAAISGGGTAEPRVERVEVLRELSFQVAPGETLGLLGPSGAGKSTLVSLLLRFYDPDSGTIRLGGEDLRLRTRKEVRERIAVVMQEPFLYSKTIRENIRHGRGAAGDEEIRSAAAAACVHESIQAFEKGYETVIGERGVTLSGGQRQRVALARALLDRPELLILDDALSAVDTETEALLLANLRQRQRRHTTILIAHRLSTLRHADRILVLDHGQVIQQGTHQELIAQEGKYRRLWEIQAAVAEEPLSSAAVQASQGPVLEPRVECMGSAG